MAFWMSRLQFSDLCILNSTVSLAVITNVVFSILEIVGINLGHAAPDVGRRNSFWGNLRESDHNQGSGPRDHSGSFGDEIRDSLTKVTVDSIAERFCCEEDAICAVCLCEYEKEDPVWLLPSCSHIFHKPCLDRWLDQNQITCPTCRSSLLTEELTQKSKKREEALTTESALWFCFYHGPAAMRSSSYGAHIHLSRQNSEENDRSL